MFILNIATLLTYITTILFSHLFSIIRVTFLLPKRISNILQNYLNPTKLQISIVTNISRLLSIWLQYFLTLTL